LWLSEGRAKEGEKGRRYTMEEREKEGRMKGVYVDRVYFLVI